MKREKNCVLEIWPGRMELIIVGEGYPYNINDQFSLWRDTDNMNDPFITEWICTLNEYGYYPEVEFC